MNTFNKVKLKQISNQQRDFILNISGFVTVSLFFISGIGSYRFFLVYAIYSLLKALKVEQKIMFVFLPAYVASFYLDVTDGPMFSHATKSYFFVVLPTFVLVDYFLNSLFKKLISNMTQDQYFVECPSCHFNNIELVEACANCSYRKGNHLGPSTDHISSLVKGDKIPDGLIPLLSLGIAEEIIFHKKLTLFSQQLKNAEFVNDFGTPRSRI
jgi:hypothetical protein